MNYSGGAQVQLASCYHLRLLMCQKQIAKAKTEIPKGPGTVLELKIQLTLFFSFLTEAGDLDVIITQGFLLSNHQRLFRSFRRKQPLSNRKILLNK